MRALFLFETSHKFEKKTNGKEVSKMISIR